MLQNGAFGTSERRKSIGAIPKAACRKSTVCYFIGVILKRRTAKDLVSGGDFHNFSEN